MSRNITKPAATSPADYDKMLDELFDRRYAIHGEKITLEKLGEQGWVLIHVQPSRDGCYVGIYERDGT